MENIQRVNLLKLVKYNLTSMCCCIGQNTLRITVRDIRAKWGVSLRGLLFDFIFSPIPQLQYLFSHMRESWLKCQSIQQTLKTLRLQMQCVTMRSWNANVTTVTHSRCWIRESESWGQGCWPLYTTFVVTFT